MNRRWRKSEHGQALVLLVLGMVALLGFTALAVDGGMLYSDRRYAQNSADSASLAGGSAAAMYFENHDVRYSTWNCSSAGVSGGAAAARQAAISRAADNGFTIDEDDSDKHGVTTQCGTDNSAFNYWTDKYLDIKTRLTMDTRSAFAHFVFGGALRNSVVAVVRVRPRLPLALGHAIVSLNPKQDCSGNQNGVVFNGNIEVSINGGGVFSNGCMVGDGTSLDVNVNNGGIFYVGELDTNHPSTFEPAATQASGMLPPFAFDEFVPDCSAVAHYGSPSNAYQNHASGVIPPGNYTSINANGNITLVGGGLYCLYGDFDTGNVDVNIDTSGGMDGVTIYMIAGDFTTGGNGEVHLAAPLGPQPGSAAIPGMLIIMDENNHGLIKLRGNSDSAYHGTIYAPNGTIDIAGDPSASTPDGVTFYTQLIGKDVFVGGNTNIDITYLMEQGPWVPSTITLYE